jgi:hypothetical protein
MRVSYYDVGQAQIRNGKTGPTDQGDVAADERILRRPFSEDRAGSGLGKATLRELRSGLEGRAGNGDARPKASRPC